MISLLLIVPAAIFELVTALSKYLDRISTVKSHCCVAIINLVEIADV